MVTQRTEVFSGIKRGGAKFVTFVNSSLVSFSNLQLSCDSIRKVVFFIAFFSPVERNSNGEDNSHFEK